jgi:hypothetical protein
MGLHVACNTALQMSARRHEHTEGWVLAHLFERAVLHQGAHSLGLLLIRIETE